MEDAFFMLDKAFHKIAIHEIPDHKSAFAIATQQQHLLLDLYPGQSEDVSGMAQQCRYLLAFLRGTLI